MNSSLTFRRLAATLGALCSALLLSSCGMLETVSLDPAPAAGRTTATAPAPAPSRTLDPKTGLPARPAQCVKEGDSCRDKADTCCAGLVCAGIGASFCINRN